MRRLSDTFCDCLRDGFLSGITENVNADPDLALEIRENYINLYYKGNALLKLTENKTLHYRSEIHPKYLAGVQIPKNLPPIPSMTFYQPFPF